MSKDVAPCSDVLTICQLSTNELDPENLVGFVLEYYCSLSVPLFFTRTLILCI